MDGIINIYKEKGYTSHDVTAIIKKLFKGEKVGHAGTLDPDAEGVLVVLIGRGTKLSDYFMNGEKEYRASVKFGAVTSTYDSTGEVIEEREVSFSEAELIKAIDSFIGIQEQIPPMYSAIKKDGKKLYDLARKGVAIEREARKIIISDIYLEQWNGLDEAVIYIKCGKGTYVRSICHDLGEKLGCGAYMAALTRTKSGGFSSECGIRLNELKEIYEKHGTAGLDNALVTLDAALSGYNRIVINKSADKLLYNGAKLGEEFFSSLNIEKLNIIYDERENLIGIYEAVENENGALYLKPRTMIYRG